MRFPGIRLVEQIEQKYRRIRNWQKEKRKKTSDWIVRLFYIEAPANNESQYIIFKETVIFREIRKAFFQTLSMDVHVENLEFNVFLKISLFCLREVQTIDRTMLITFINRRINKSS